MAVGPLYSGLSSLLLPGTPILAAQDAQPVSDGWSLTWTDSAVVASVLLGASDTWALGFSAESAAVQIVAATAASDTWSLSFSGELASLVAQDPPIFTELGPLLLPWSPNDYTARVSEELARPAGTDSWGLGWIEQPTDLVIIDTWDVWALRFTTESVAASISQTFAASDNWAVGLLDVGSVFIGGPVLQSRADTWSLSFTETAFVAATVSAADTWSIQITDAGAITVSSDNKNGTDAWALSFTLETAFFQPVVDIPVIGSDEWSLTYVEVSHLVPFGNFQSARRIVSIRAVNRIVRKE